MVEQNLQNHRKFLVAYHGIAFMGVLVSLITAIIILMNEGVTTNSIFVMAVAIALVWIFILSRQFGTQNQDRIIRAEENMRSYLLTGKVTDSRLTRGQLIALRFADDSEFVELSSRAIKENLSPKQIKMAITKWRADHHRI